MRIALSVVIALILTFGFLAIVMSPNSTQTGHATGDVVKIVVAGEPVKYGLRLTEKELSFCKWIKTEELEGYFTDTEKLVDRATKTTIPKGIPIVEDMLMPEGASLFGKDGKGSMLVEVGHKGASKIFPPGCRVNVIGVYRGTGRAVTSQTILTNVEVLPHLLNSEKRTSSSTVFLAVAPTEAEKLALVSKQGTIKLMVCNPEPLKQAEQAPTEPLPQPTDIRRASKLAGKASSAAKRPPQLLPRGPSPELLFAEAETHLRAFIKSGKRDETERQKAIQKFEEIYIKHPKSKLAPMAKEKTDALWAESSRDTHLNSFREKMSEIRKAADDSQFELALQMCQSAQREFKDWGHPSLADELPQSFAKRHTNKFNPAGAEEEDGEGIKAEVVIAVEEDRIKKLKRDADRLGRLVGAYLQRNERDKAKSYYQELKKLYPKSSYLKPEWSEIFDSPSP